MTLPTSLSGASRLTLDDGVRLFEHPDLLEVAALANRDRERRHTATSHTTTQHPHRATNVCVGEVPVLFVRADCGRGNPSYTMSLEDAWQKLRIRHDQPLTEVHVVNACIRIYRSSILEMLRGFKRIRHRDSSEGFHRRRNRVSLPIFYQMTDEQVLRD